MKGSWTAAAITDELLRLKGSGWPRDDFDGAWRVAMKRCPPRGCGTNVAGETLVAFTRRVCRDAWEGRRPGVAGFTADALRLSVGRDLSRDAGGHRRWDHAA